MKVETVEEFLARGGVIEKIAKPKWIKKPKVVADEPLKVVRNEARYWVGDRELTISQIAEAAGVTRTTVRSRVRRGIKGEALLAPPHSNRKRPPQHTFHGHLTYLRDIARVAGVSERCIYQRIKAGCTLEEAACGTLKEAVEAREKGYLPLYGKYVDVTKDKK